MLFSSTTFLFFFLPAVVLAYFASPRNAWRNGWLLFASLLFYAWGEARFLPALLGSIFVTYGTGRLLARCDAGARGRWLILGVAANLALLAVFKYADFVVENANVVLVWMGIRPLDLPSIPLPLGISFFVFQAVSYLVDIYRREARPARSLGDLGLYISMFPQLVAGPIVRYRTVSWHLRGRTLTWARSAFGCKLFAIGLAQKVLIADQVAPLADVVFGSQLGTPTMLAAWLGLVAYTVQIYYDFGGYSNMAIGLGLVFGFGFPRNFRFPYSARSVSEFWRRWHISLSSWFRDYLYIPLGGNRGGRWRTGRNLLIVFLLCGIWHGASWNFVIWGLHHGAFLVAERGALGRALARAGPVIRMLYTLAVVMSGWVWFRAETVGQAVTMFRSLSGFSKESGLDPLVAHAMTPLALWALAIGIVLSFRWSTVRIPGFVPRHAWNDGALFEMATRRICLVGLIIVASSFVASGAYSPFLYFRF